MTDKNFAYWHSATFNNDGTKVIFTDEWGGGTRPRCRATDPPTWGADAIFDIVDRKLRFGGYYKLPAPQTDQENCVAHNGSLIPVPGRDIMVQAWYQGGVSVFDFTDSTKPVEIAFFDRGPLDAKKLITGGYWSTYWYNGHIYGTEIARGLDVFKLTPSEYLIGERDRGGHGGAAGRLQRAAADARRPGRRPGGRACLSRSARAAPRRRRRSRRGDQDGRRARRPRARAADRSAAAAAEQLKSLAGQVEGGCGRRDRTRRGEAQGVGRDVDGRGSGSVDKDKGQGKRENPGSFPSAFSLRADVLFPPVPSP